MALKKNPAMHPSCHCCIISRLGEPPVHCNKDSCPVKKFGRYCIHTDKEGFLGSQEALDNTSKTNSFGSKTEYFLLPFIGQCRNDLLSWRFLLHYLCQINLREKLINKIMALYTTLSSQICTNGSLSAPFKIFNGTRQGCPLSPLLYVVIIIFIIIKVLI